MVLADDILILRERTLVELTAAHDYYADTRTVWRVAHRLLASGRSVRTRNIVTGTIITQADLAARARGYVAVQLAEATFQQFLSIFESFYLEFVCLWLTAYPRSLGRKTVDFKTILDLPDKDAVIRAVVMRETSEVLHDRPAGWFAYLEEKVKLGCPTAEEIDRLAEAKASRDVLVHNSGTANKTYADKAGKLARFRDGERISIPDDYHRATWELIRKVVSDVTDAAVAKAKVSG